MVMKCLPLISFLRENAVTVSSVFSAQSRTMLVLCPMFTAASPLGLDCPYAERERSAVMIVLYFSGIRICIRTLQQFPELCG